MRNFIKVAVIAAIINVIGLSAVAFSADSVGGRPANPDPKNPRTNTIFILTMDRGQTAGDQALVVNSSGETRTVELYAVDGVVTNTGAYTCEQRAESRDGVGSWVKLAKQEVALEPGAREVVDFSLTVPQNADVGEHNGCIVLQTRDDEDGETVGNVRIRTRQAIRVAITVPGELRKEASIENFAVDSGAKGEQFSLQLSNTGNVSADVNAYVYLSTLWGKDIYKNGGGYPVLANEKLDLTFDLDKKPFWGGWYIASADIAYDSRAGVFGFDNPDHLVRKSSDELTVFLMPSAGGMLALVGLLLLVAGLVGWLLWRRQQALAVKREWVECQVRQGDTINSLADRHKINWRKLAKANQLRAPYDISQRDVLRVPALDSTEPILKSAKRG